jgi:hypothetical protein
MRTRVLLLSLCVSGCVSLTPAGAHVSVYEAPLDGLAARRTMPDGCARLSASAPVSMPELDLEGQKNPFRVERNEAGAAGANALLVLKQMTRSREDFNCPTTSPITDCAPSFGAWYRVVVERYACTPHALSALAAIPPNRAPSFP